MKTQTLHHLSCRQCRFFQPEGHYYGSCSRMMVTVRGEWQACALVVSPFSRSHNGQQVAA